MDLSSTVSWEFAGYWGSAIKSYFPRYGERGELRGWPIVGRLPAADGRRGRRQRARRRRLPRRAAGAGVALRWRLAFQRRVALLRRRRRLPSGRHLRHGRGRGKADADATVRRMTAYAQAAQRAPPREHNQVQGHAPCTYGTPCPCISGTIHHYRAPRFPPDLRHLRAVADLHPRVKVGEGVQITERRV